MDLRNRIVLDDRIMTSGAVAVMCSDDVPIRAVVSQGCRPIGNPYTVTGADGARITELEMSETKVESNCTLLMKTFSVEIKLVPVM